ncbi:hypothetical protein Pmani_012446 [Petrolisthes manimaculis]|uniref:Uncharacterized protein n=1 Tax=Petrolisthes manimaculis TaxID=1843537 RepID=A0AAE1PXB5_9EUCA|nr:hypothetical protein Pmani_012446 [Petrolisthes manimaculis]
MRQLKQKYIREKKTQPLPPRTEEQETWISVVVNGMILKTMNLVKDHSCAMIMHLCEMYGTVHPKLSCVVKL